MTTITIADKYANTLRTFGNLQEAVDLALQRYTIEQITHAISQLRQRETVYRAKYNTDYATFAQQTAQDSAYVAQITATITPLWEQDLLDWEFCQQGIEEWTQTLQTLLLG